nr:immunoglobulin heavy chain junction region [Mus musculus]
DIRITTVVATVTMLWTTGVK